MNIIRTTTSLIALTDELRSVALQRIPDASGSAHMGGPDGWIRGLRMARFEPSAYPLTRDLIDVLRDHVQVGKLVQAMLNLLEPGGELSPHRDGLPEYDRYHYPIVSHPDAFWWDERNGMIHMDEGCWYGPVPYCGVMHSAGNPTTVQRVHLVVDFEKGKA